MKKNLCLLVILFLLFLMVGCVPGSDDSVLPSISTISPASGSRGETIDLIITGNHLSGVTSISFGPDVSIKVNSFEIVNSNEIRVNITIYSTAGFGPKDITIVNPNGSAKKNKVFMVAGVPTIVSVLPNAGPQGAAMDVEIFGEGFYGVTEVVFGPDAAGISTVNFQITSEYNPVIITANIKIASDYPVGLKDVKVVTNHGTVIKTDSFTVTPVTNPLAPIVASVNPTGWIIGSTINVTIKGSNFSGTPVVSFGSGVNVNSVTLISSSEIKVNITIDSLATLGWRDVSVTVGSLTGVGTKLFEVYTLL